MQVVDSLSALAALVAGRRSAVTFGNFDGVHLGHKALLGQVRAAAASLSGPAVVVTFDPHPLALLRPERAPACIDTLDGRLNQLAGQGIDAALVLRFDAALAARSAEWFATEVLLAAANAGHIVAGHDTRFGHQGAGDVPLLQRLATRQGATVAQVGPVLFGGEVVSSSRVRRAVSAGATDVAWRLLERPFALAGEVVQGDQRGRTIGFPTANVAAPAQVQPRAGVYAAWLQTPDHGWLPAVVNCGTRPTFDGQRWQVEAHVPGFSGDLYHQQVRLHFGPRLRDEQRFAGLDALLAQIRADTAAALEWLARADPAAPQPPPS